MLLGYNNGLSERISAGKLKFNHLRTQLREEIELVDCQLDQYFLNC